MAPTNKVNRVAAAGIVPTRPTAVTTVTPCWQKRSIEVEPKFPLTTFEDVLAVLVTVPVEYEVLPNGYIRCVEPVITPNAVCSNTAGCPLNVIATAYGLTHWNQVAANPAESRVFFAADKRGPYRHADRALLLQACGLA